MKVHELAKKAQVTPETVRHYTRKGLLSARKDDRNGYHIYDASAVRRLRFIQQARTLGFSLSQIAEIFSHEQHGDSPCPMVRQMLLDKMLATKDKIQELQQSLNRMEQAMSAWESMVDGIPDGHSICCLIEQWEQTNDASGSSND